MARTDKVIVRLLTWDASAASARSLQSAGIFEAKYWLTAKGDLEEEARRKPWARAFVAELRPPQAA